MDKIKFFLKFGQRKHVESFAKGSLYCSNAQTFWNIENVHKIKGQGDKLEASSRIYAQKITVYDWESGNFVGVLPTSSGLVRFESAEHIPIFCLYTVYEKDCITGSDGIIKISLLEEAKKTIREHFPRADTVAIVADPEQFLLDIENSIGCDIKHGSVRYFNIDKGFLEDDGRYSMDMEYMKYLMQDSSPIVNGNIRTYKFYEKYVYRYLFCKDNYFKGEKEYRIVLPHEKILTGTTYPVKYTKQITVMNLDEFLEA